MRFVCLIAHLGAGESYGGVYVPMLVTKLLEHNNRKADERGRLNLQARVRVGRLPDSDDVASLP
jgi:hypothetical protein